MFMLEVGELRAGSSLPTPVPVFVPKVTLKEEGVAGSGEMRFIAGGCLASGLSRERSFNADQRSLPHREGPLSLCSQTQSYRSPTTPHPECWSCLLP